MLQAGPKNPLGHVANKWVASLVSSAILTPSASPQTIQVKKPTDHSLHVDLDAAWNQGVVPTTQYLDCQTWGPRLRYSSTRQDMERFYEHVAPHAAPFTLFGSGDFHHLSALWLRRITVPFCLVSFDNHPDWDTRPPFWGCGTWINHALRMPLLQKVAIWGCGNFELNWPSSLFANHHAIRSGRLLVKPWNQRFKPATQKRWPGLERSNWRETFDLFANSLSGLNIYVTVDLDCLHEAHAVTNWEQGLFETTDIVWALNRLHEAGQIIGGDVCGAYSSPSYSRIFQKLLGVMDHPRKSTIDHAHAARTNAKSLVEIWGALTGGNHDASTDQNGTHH